MTRKPSQPDVEKLARYASMLYKLGMVYLSCRQDAEDLGQEALFRLLYRAPEFRDREHEKAWLIRVMINLCKNELRGFWRKNRSGLTGNEPYDLPEEDVALLQSILALPPKYKSAVHLHYYEGYSVKETANILRLSESAVKMRLSRAREILRFELYEE